MKILVLDVGRSHVKCIATDHNSPVKFKSVPKLPPDNMVRKVLKITKGWRFDTVSVSYRSVVRHGKIVREPHNLSSGWVGFDFGAAFGRPVQTINDAAMHLLGGWEQQSQNATGPIRSGWVVADESNWHGTATNEAAV